MAESEVSYRMKQTERGNEALKMFADFLESKNGLLSVSIHESMFSSGCHSQPDIVFKAMGIEVKRVEMFTASKCMKGDKPFIYGHLGNMWLAHDEWNRLKEWCITYFKIPMVVVVLTYKNQKPIFVRFTQDQIDEFQKEQIKKSGIHLNVCEILREGEIWK